MRIALGVLLGVALLAAVHAQSGPDQPNSPEQQQSAPAQPQQGTDAQQAPAAPAGSAPAEQKPPAENQTAAPQPDETPRDANVPVLKHRPTRKKSHKKPANTRSDKVVVRNGGAREGSPELAPGSSQKQQQERENTKRLLATTDTNLKNVAGRQLTPAQQSMMEQIRTYIAQSNAASSSGDVDRAHTLAYKAQLLSDELAKK